MAEVSQHRTGELVRGVFASLLDTPEGLPASQVLRLVEQQLPPTDYEQADYPSNPGIRRYEKIVRFATINAVKAGWLVKSKGTWTLTDEGRSAYTTLTDPEAFQREAVRLYRNWKNTQPEPAAGDQHETIQSGFEEADEAAWQEIRDYLAAMPPYDFQNLVAALLGAMGYHVLWIAPPGPDRGIDMIAHTDPLGMTSPRIKIQVKRQTDTRIAVDGLRSFLAVLGDQDVGIYVSAGGFTSDAQREARSQEKRRLTLIDLDRLIELWIQHLPHLDDSQRQQLPLKPIYFLAPHE